MAKLKQSGRVMQPHTRRIDFVSDVNGRSYSLFVALPLCGETAEKYRVLYVLDGNFYFATAVEAVRSRPEADDVMVVGLGYPQSRRFAAQALKRHHAALFGTSPTSDTLKACKLERVYDLTLPAETDLLAHDFAGGDFVPTTQDVGGLDEFLDLLETEVRLLVADQASRPIGGQAIFGHSLGGLAVIYALFRAPGAYQAFIASSPSLWWNRKAVLHHEAKFAEMIETACATPRVLITVGQDEESLTAKIVYGDSEQQKKWSYLLKSRRMVGNAKDLAARLSALKGPDGYFVENCVVFPGMGHQLAPWPAIARAVPFAFGIV